MLIAGVFRYPQQSMEYLRGAEIECGHGAGILTALYSRVS